MPIHLPQLREALLPAGIHPGTPLSRPLREALTSHLEIPVIYQPVIEEGDYDAFKSCVFRVCSLQVCDTALEDIRAEITGQKASVQIEPRRWFYAPGRCVTMARLRVEVATDSPLRGEGELEKFFGYLSQRYDFAFNQISVNTSRTRMAMDREIGVYLLNGVSMQIDMEIIWPSWR